MSNSFSIIFAGTSDFSAYHLKALICSSYKVDGVFTKPDQPDRRGKRLLRNPVKQLAKQYSLPIFQPSSFNKLEREEWTALLKTDIMVVVSYGLILPPMILDLPRFGCINVHGSLLPRWRGAAPIQRALWAGDDKTGITIIQMDSGLDTGAILHKTTCTIQTNDTSASLCNKLAKIGANALLSTLERIFANSIMAQPQNKALVTYANKLNKHEARLDWRKPAVYLERCIRAFNPWPISYFLFFGKRIKVWGANVDAIHEISYMPGTILDANKTGIYVATGKGVLQLTHLQLESRKVISASELLNARRKWFSPGTLLD